MMLRLEQVFYGSGPRGYAVLGASPRGEAFAKQAEALCGGLGTPAGEWGGSPFLLSVPAGERILMACGRRGSPDSMGRETLFFHVLAATRAELDAAGADAFSLFSQGVFAGQMPDGRVEALYIDAVRTERPSGGSLAGKSPPVVIRADGPAPDAVRALLGGRTNDCAWTTFAFRAMDGFDVQVLPRHAAAPAFARECDVSGQPIRPGNPPTACNADRQRATVHGRPSTGTRSLPPNPPPTKASAMTKLSLAANVLLAVLCAVLLVARKPEDAKPESPANAPETAVPDAESARLEKECRRLSADNEALAGKIGGLKAENRELRQEAARYKAEADGAANRFWGSLPEYFTEEQCAEAIRNWNLNKEDETHLCHVLYQWTKFFDNHPKTATSTTRKDSVP